MKTKQIKQIAEKFFEKSDFGDDWKAKQDTIFGFRVGYQAGLKKPNEDGTVTIGVTELRELFDELINAGRDMQARDDNDSQLLPYLHEDDYFESVKLRYGFKVITGSGS